MMGRWHEYEHLNEDAEKGDMRSQELLESLADIPLELDIVVRDPNVNRLEAFTLATKQMYELVRTYEPERTITRINIARMIGAQYDEYWTLMSDLDNGKTFRYLIYINASTGNMETDGV